MGQRSASRRFVRAPRRVGIVKPAHDGGAVLALQPPDGEMAAGDTLKVIHENHIDRGAADRAEHRQRARRGALRTTTPNRVAISVTRPPTTGAETLATLRSARSAVASPASRLISARAA